MSGRVLTLRGACAAALIAALLGAAPTPATTMKSGMNPTAPAAASEPSEDIRDIRGPKYVMPAWLVPALLAATALLALGAYRARRWHRRRQARALLPFETALQRLDGIRVLMQPASVREFSIAVSDIVRHYIEQRFDVTATQQTTEEFLRDLLDYSHPSLVRHRAVLSEFLNQCDLVKFAGVSLSIQGMESLHGSARAFVLETAKPEIPIQSPSGKEAHDPLPST
jgi:hypothetical protein